MRNFLFAGASIITVLVAGCGTGETKPSYADLVVIYNAEAETLERLERKRADMVAQHEATLQPNAEQAIQTLLGSLNDASDVPQLDATDPNDQLDQAVDYLESAGAQQKALLEAASGQAAARSADRANIESMYSAEFKAKLAELDAEIAAQRARVEKARAARDAAESE